MNIVTQTLTPRDWVAHVARMKAEEIQCWLVSGDPDLDHSVWDVTSGTVAGLLYRVEHTANYLGVQLTCDCEAGKHQKVCKHIAAVATQLGLINEDSINQLRMTIAASRDIEREKALQQRREERAAQRHEQKMAKLLQPGDRCRAKKTSPEKLRNRMGVVEFTTEANYRVAFEAIDGQPAFTAWVPHSFMVAAERVETSSVDNSVGLALLRGKRP